MIKGITQESRYDKETRTAYLSSGQVVRNFHDETQCLGERCPLHKPSDHNFRGLPLGFEDGIMVRYDDKFAGGFIADPDDYRLNKEGSVIIRKSIKCALCGDEIESKYRHDFQTCQCGVCSVDGGRDYRRIVGNPGTFIDTSIVQHVGDIF